MTTQSPFQPTLHLVTPILTVLLENRKNKILMSRSACLGETWAREHGTITLNLGRQAGHTTAVKDYIALIGIKHSATIIVTMSQDHAKQLHHCSAVFKPEGIDYYSLFVCSYPVFSKMAQGGRLPTVGTILVDGYSFLPKNKEKVFYSPNVLKVFGTHAPEYVFLG